MNQYGDGTQSMPSYEVKVWSIRIAEGIRGKTYRVRWQVGAKQLSKTFKTRALADSFRSELLSAASRGEAFDEESGAPISKMISQRSKQSWYAHACEFVDLKWRTAAAKTRASIADTLSTATPALVTAATQSPDPRDIRRALYGWSFNAGERANGAPPASMAKTIRWVERHSLPVTSLSDPAVLRRVLDALATRQDGTPAAAGTLLRKRAVLHNTLEYAVELGHLPSNPMTRLKWTPPKTAESVDPRALIDRKRAEALLAAVGEQGTMGRHLVAFFGCMYYAAMRPAEVVNLRHADLTLPETADTWGEFHLSGSAPSVAPRWTDSGSRREPRQLKHRAREEVRPVPCHPRLVQLLRAHLDEFDVAPDGRLFRARYYNRPLSDSVYGRIWHKARRIALTEREADSPLARRPYDLRHACVTNWLNAGVDAAQVAQWAGHSVAVLLRVYVRCIVGRDEIAKRRIEQAFRDDE